MKKITLLTLSMLMILSVSIFSQKKDHFHMKKTVEGSFEEVTVKTKTALKNNGFGVVTETDMDKKLKSKLDNVELKPYKILGVCNPSSAYKSIQTEDNIGLFLPCKVLIKDIGNGKVEVVMVDPSLLMAPLDNKELDTIAEDVTTKLSKVLKEI